MNFRKLLNYKPNKEAGQTTQARALRWLAGFCALMLACTLLSRAADSLTVATVTVEKPSQSAISHSISIDGRLEAGSETVVPVFAGARVKSVATREGETVKAGDPLLTLDVTDITEQQLREQLTLQKLNLNLAEAQKTAANDKTKTARSKTRAEEDLELALERADEEKWNAADELRRARDEMRDYREQNGGDTDDDVYRALRRAYYQQQSVYDIAVLTQNKAVLDARRAIEDLSLAEVDYRAQIAALDVRLQALTLERFAAVLEADGVVTAPIDAVVTKADVKAGEKTSDSTTLLLAESREGFRFTGNIPAEQLKYLARGDEAELKLAGGGDVRGLRVQSIRATDDPNISEVSLELPPGKGELGMAAVLTAGRRSQSYSTVVPLSALHSENSQKYLLVLRETETVLGAELSVERVDVTVSEQNETKAAVSGALSGDDRVVTTASKPLSDGDRVRLLTP